MISQTQPAAAEGICLPELVGTEKDLRSMTPNQTRSTLLNLMVLWQTVMFG